MGNAISGIFRTANSAATTITNFDDPYDAQQFTLLINDSNTTLQHNAGLILKGAVNVTPTNGSVFQFFRDAGGPWREASRSIM